MIAALIAIRLVHWLDDALELQASWHPDTVRAVLGALAGSLFTVIVFVCSSLLLVVQLASAQLTPRVIGIIFRDPVTKFSLVVFVFNFIFVLSALVRINTYVPMLSTQIAAYSCVLSLGFFLYLIDHVGKMLRPSSVVQRVAAQAHQVIDNVYPRRLGNSRDSIEKSGELVGQNPTQTVTNPQAGVVLAFDLEGLVALGIRHDCVVEMVPQVGNFVAPGDPLFRIFGGAGLLAETLRQAIAVGAERTMEQDPMFGFRVIVDIASKGLSPAINDPTTAVLAIDQIHHLLRHVGKRNLENEKIRDATGRVRLIFRTPNWEDFITLAVTEIRQYGGTSIQVARRLRAMLENLIETLSPERAAALRKELALLKRTAERWFQEPEDRALADISDAQGVGGTR
jgi:uncharacterized membrane protein